LPTKSAAVPVERTRRMRSRVRGASEGKKRERMAVAAHWPSSHWMGAMLITARPPESEAVYLLPYLSGLPPKRQKDADTHGTRHDTHGTVP